MIHVYNNYALAYETKKRYTRASLCDTPKPGFPWELRFHSGGIAMIEATSCGGVVIFRGKILVLYKNYKNKYEGWVLPKGTVEAGEEYKETALREVKEETGVSASIIKYIGKSQYSFNTPQDMVEKDVHWYLMMADSYYSKPQREEYFIDSGYYKFHEAYHLLKFSNEKQILEKAYNEYLDLKKSNLWGNKKYF
jgi:ADP-ribose pyrophosphatase YjhB (NUDIX family)